MYFMPLPPLITAAPATNFSSSSAKREHWQNAFRQWRVLSAFPADWRHLSMEKLLPTSVTPKSCCAVLDGMRCHFGLWPIQSSASLLSALINALVDTNRDGLRREMTCFFPSFHPVQQLSPVHTTHIHSLLMAVASLPPAGQSSLLPEVQEQSILQLWKCHQITARWAFTRGKRPASQQTFSKHVHKSSLSHMPVLPRPIPIPTE